MYDSYEVIKNMLHLCNWIIPVQHLYNPLKQMNIKNIMWQIDYKYLPHLYPIIDKSISRNTEV